MNSSKQSYDVTNKNKDPNVFIFTTEMTSNISENKRLKEVFVKSGSIIFQPKHIKPKPLFLFNSIQVQSCHTAYIWTVAYLLVLHYQWFTNIVLRLQLPPPLPKSFCQTLSETPTIQLKTALSSCDPSTKKWLLSQQGHHYSIDCCTWPLACMHHEERKGPCSSPSG